jgi:hypothetical protein
MPAVRDGPTGRTSYPIEGPLHVGVRIAAQRCVRVGSARSEKSRADDSMASVDLARGLRQPTQGERKHLAGKERPRGSAVGPVSNVMPLLRLITLRIARRQEEPECCSLPGIVLGP